MSGQVRPFRDLCPEADRRDAMTDDEFWQHVSDNLGVNTQPDDDWDEHDTSIDAAPCPECGESGACGWDSEGRPLIHAIRGDDQ